MSKRINVTEQEIFEICYKVINQGKFTAGHLMEEVEHQFKILNALDAQNKPSWLSKNGSTVFLVAAVGFFALTVKIMIESFWGIR